MKRKTETWQRTFCFSWAAPDEIAGLAGFLMSEQAAFVTGATFLMDGGATASYFYGPLRPEAG